MNTESCTLLSIDCGTQSLRALIFSVEGRLLARACVAYTPYVSPGPGLAEQDPEIYWDALVRACRALRETAPGPFRNICGMGVTTQRNTLINVDEKGLALRPAIVWLDQREARPVFGTSGPLSLLLRMCRVQSKLCRAQAQGKCNWIMQNEPGIWASTHKYLQVSGFLNYRLTGVFKDSAASQIGHLPFDYRRRRWAGPGALASRLFPVPLPKLPELVAPGKILAPLTPEAAAMTGLPHGIPVVACGSDKGCETLGAGVTDATRVSLSLGTTATVQTVSPRYFEPIPFMPAYPSPQPGCYNAEVEIFRGFWMISWFKNEFAGDIALEAERLGVPAEQLLDRCLARTGPGATGLILHPYWGPGLDYPDARGAMVGFGDAHGRDHVYRALVEGLGFALFAGMERIRARSRVTVRGAVLSGGASQSDAICQIAADIFNLPMTRGATHEASGLGAAILTSAATGCHVSISEAAQKMTRPCDSFSPDSANARLYREIYTRVYRRMHRALSPLNRELRKIAQRRVT